MPIEPRHSGVKPEEEFVHLDYPRDDPAPWKENWGWLVNDPENDVACIYHITLEREKKRARLACWNTIAGEKYHRQYFFDIDENFTELAHGPIKIEFVKPLEEIRITDISDEYELDITFTGRFDVYDYAGHYEKEDSAMVQEGLLNIRHYEQALNAKGTFVKNGETLSFGGVRLS